MRAILVAASLLLTGLLFAPGATAAEVGDCIGKSGEVQVCQNLTQPALRHCVSVGVGLQGGSVCYGVGGGEVCTSVNGRTCVPVNV